MKRIYNIKETCKKHNCDRDALREVVLQELSNEFPPYVNYKFNLKDEVLIVDILYENR